MNETIGLAPQGGERQGGERQGGERHGHETHGAQEGHQEHGQHGDGRRTSKDASFELESETAQRMAEAATNFLAALNGDQREQATFPVSSDERMNWHYIPRERQGLPFREMDGCQQKLAHALISSGLSRRGYAKAVTIMSLEKVLGLLEGTTRRFPRDPDLYYMTVFGTPSDQHEWGWRVEGHHVSLNFLVVDGQRIAPTPSFFGANPARVPDGAPGALSGLRVLSAEEDLARRLLGMLDEPRRRRVVLADEAPADILTRAERKVNPDAPAGLAAAEMTGEQRHVLMDLVEEYVERMPDDIAGTRLDRIEKEGTRHIHFAWAGSAERGPHYYRVQGPSFLVEYDNTQNNANHIHTVWRDLASDWGEDLLAGHYARSH